MEEDKEKVRLSNMLYFYMRIISPLIIVLLGVAVYVAFPFNVFMLILFVIAVTISELRKWLKIKNIYYVNVDKTLVISNGIKNINVDVCDIKFVDINRKINNKSFIFLKKQTDFGEKIPFYIKRKGLKVDEKAISIFGVLPTSRKNE